jgi:hypothetical protein
MFDVADDDDDRISRSVGGCFSVPFSGFVDH